MKKPASGLGSTLVVLVFTVLCLTIFMLISLSTARTSKALADKEAETVIAYYEADFLAECILAEMMETAEMPDIIRGVNISYDVGVASFSCPISDNKELYVEVADFGDSYEILEWRMRDIDEWEADSGLPVWSGD